MKVTKKCYICKEEKELHLLAKCKNRVHGRSSLCNKCDNKRGKEYRMNHPDYQRNRDLQRAHGISSIQYDFVSKAQNNKCVICLKKCRRGTRLHTDHNHTTGKIRGLLCNGCNTGLGQFQDNIKTLEAAIEYLKVHSGSL